MALVSEVPEVASSVPKLHKAVSDDKCNRKKYKSSQRKICQEQIMKMIENLNVVVIRNSGDVVVHP